MAALIGRTGAEVGHRSAVSMSTHQTLVAALVPHESEVSLCVVVAPVVALTKVARGGTGRFGAGRLLFGVSAGRRLQDDVHREVGPAHLASAAKQWLKPLMYPLFTPTMAKAGSAGRRSILAEPGG